MIWFDIILIWRIHIIFGAILKQMYLYSEHKWLENILPQATKLKKDTLTFTCTFFSFSMIPHPHRTTHKNKTCLVLLNMLLYYFIFACCGVLTIHISRLGSWLYSHTLITWPLASKWTLICLTTMRRNVINFLHNTGYVTLWCLKVVLVVYAWVIYYWNIFIRTWIYMAL